jgi:hypothetical protein
MKNIIKSLGVIILATIIVAGVSYAAGSLTPPAGSPSNTSYTLMDLDNLKTNTRVSPGSGPVPNAPVGNPALTFRSITDVYNSLTTELNKLTPDKIKDGEFIFGVRGTYTGSGTPSSLTWSPDNGHTTMFAPSICDYPGLCSLCYENSTYNSGSCSYGVMFNPLTHEDDDGRRHTHNWYSSRGYVKSGLNNSGNVILGAKEYCQYLQPDGTTLGLVPTSPQYWRLPTRTELTIKMVIALGSGSDGLANDGFINNKYWTNEAKVPGNEINRKIVQIDAANGMAQIVQSWVDSKSKNFGTRCVHSN